MNKQTIRKKSPWKFLLFALAALLLAGIVTSGILYLKIYEPRKRSSDLGRLQQESYQGIFLSMSAPEAFPLGIFNEILETRAGGVISSHCGPGTLGVLFIEK